MTPEVAAALLPPSRPRPRPRPEGRPTPYRVAVVCLGNICRSPMADVVLNDRLIRAGLERLVEVVSAGTGDWHVGRPMDRRGRGRRPRRPSDGPAGRRAADCARVRRQPAPRPAVRLLLVRRL